MVQKFASLLCTLLLLFILLRTCVAAQENQPPPDQGNLKDAGTEPATVTPTEVPVAPTSTAVPTVTATLTETVAPTGQGELPCEGTPQTATPVGQAGGRKTLLSPRFASTLLGFAIYNAEQDRIIPNSGLIVETESWRVKYLLLSQDDRMVPVPWTAFRELNLNPRFPPEQSPEDSVLVLNVSGRTLETAPTFGPDELARLRTLGPEELQGAEIYDWDAGVEDYWRALGFTDTDEEGTGLPLLITAFGESGFDVVTNLRGQILGNLADLIVEPDGRIRYLVVESEGKLIPVPIDQTFWSFESQSLIVPVGAGFFNDAIGFPRDTFPDLARKGWDDHVVTFWGHTGCLVLDAPVFVSDVLDFPVFSLASERVAQVQDLVAETKTWLVRYVMVQDGEDVVPLPWNALLILDDDPRDAPHDDPDDLAFVHSLSERLIEVAPRFNPENLAALRSLSPDELQDNELMDWDAGVRRYWDDFVDAPLLQDGQRGLPLLMRADMFQSPVLGLDGSELGHFADGIVDPSGQLLYAVIAAGDKLIPVPMELLSWSFETRSLFMPAGQAFFENAYGFQNQDDFPDLGEEDWDRLIVQYWFLLTPTPNR